MDDGLLALIEPEEGSTPPGESRELSTRMRVFEETPQIEVERPGGPGGEARHYVLKPLTDLYDTGTGLASVDTQSDRFLPILLAIEEVIVRYNEKIDRTLTDGSVLLVLKQMGMDPDHEPADRLGRRIHLAPRLRLSLNNYSRQDVKGCLRQVAKSVQRHTRAEGPRGYLMFVRRFFGH